MAIVKLGDIIEVVSGLKPNKNLSLYLTSDFNDGISWVKQSDVDDGLLSRTKTFFKKEFINLTRITDGNETYFFPDCNLKVFKSEIIFAFDPHTWMLKPKNNLIMKKFIWIILMKNLDKLWNNKHGTTIPFITKNDFNNFKIFLPDLETQNKIISIIEPFEKYNIHLTKIINILEQIIDKQFLIFNKNDKKILNEKFFLGFNYNSNSYKNFGLYKLFKISNISTDKPTVFIDKPINILEIGDVVTGLSGTIGSAKIIYESNWTLNQRILCIKSKYQNVIKKVIEINKNFLIQIATGSVQKNLTSKQVLELSFDKRLENYFNYFSSKLIININIIINNVNKIISFLIKILLQ